MKLQTNIPLKKQPRNLIDYNSNLVLLGSCFSQNIGKKLDYFKFKNLQNPFGILFHPKAIENLIEKSINLSTIEEHEIIFQNEQWHCLNAHSSLSDVNRTKLITKLDAALKITNRSLKEASHIIITLGTSWAYRHIESDNIVANCHKIPQKKFLKELLTIDEISESLEAIIALIKSINKETTVLFTVSPIRHLKDGFIENSQSKSHLISGIHQVVDKRKNTHYFPSYEIMMDELRDYRFYAEDMIHPNKTAIDYIWEKFKQVWFSDDTSTLMKDIDVIQKGLAHKPFNENSVEHQQFLEKLEAKKNKVLEQLSHVNF